MHRGLSVPIQAIPAASHTGLAVLALVLVAAAVLAPRR
jgi:hypothetical protein